jgi:hypothetical protein
MKCCNLASKAQGLEGIIIVVHVGVVKIFVATLGALRKMRDRMKTQFTTKIDGFLNCPSPLSPPPLNAYFLSRFSLYDQTQCSGAMFSLLYR